MYGVFLHALKGQINRFIGSTRNRTDGTMTQTVHIGNRFHRIQAGFLSLETPPKGLAFPRKIRSCLSLFMG